MSVLGALTFGLGLQKTVVDVCHKCCRLQQTGGRGRIRNSDAHESAGGQRETAHHIDFVSDFFVLLRCGLQAAAML